MKKYSILLLFIIVSFMGTEITDFCLGIWVLQSKGSTVAYTLISFFAVVPQVVLGPFIGSYIDRWDKKKIIIFGQLVAGVGSLVLMLLYNLDLLVPWHIMLVAFISSVANGFVFQAYYVATISLVPKDQLSRAKGLEQTGFAIISLCVPMAAPFLYQLIDLSGVFLIDIVSFSISIVAFLFVTLGVSEKAKKQTFLKDARLVWDFFRSEKGLLYILVYYFIITFTLGVVGIMLAPMILDFSNEKTLGVLMSLVGVGTLLGGGMMSIRKGFRRPVRSVIHLNMVIASLLLIVLLRVDVFVLGAVVFCVIVCHSIINATNAAFWQTVVPDDLHGRVLGYRTMIIGAAAPLAYLVSGTLVDFVIRPSLHLIPFLEGRYPGSDRTTAVVVLFAFSGLLNVTVSMILRKKTYFKAIDRLYARKRTEATELKQHQETTGPEVETVSE